MSEARAQPNGGGVELLSCRGRQRLGGPGACPRQNGHYVFVGWLVRLAILAAVLSACSDGSDKTSPSGSPSSGRATSPSASASSTSATPQQTVVVTYGNAVTGRLMDGRPFVVLQDPLRGLCLSIGDTDFGCNSGAPVSAADRNRPTARFSVEAEGSALAYGYLPENATAVVAVLADGRRVGDHVLSNSVPRVWALPLPAGVVDFASISILYVAANGTETPALKA